MNGGRKRLAAFPVMFARCVILLLLAGFAGHAMAVTKTDCIQEQKAYLQAAIDNQINPESRSTLSADYIRKQEDDVRRFVLGDGNDSISWWAKDTGNVTNARDARTVAQQYTKFMQDEQAMLDSFRSRPYQGMGDDRFFPTQYAKSAAKWRMIACFFQARERELSGGKAGAGAGDGVVKSVAAVPEECSSQNTAAANQAVGDIDSQIGAFLDSPQGRNTGTATPSLQVVMWAADASAKVIGRYCPEGVGFKERLAELKRTYDSAMQTCRTIQGNPEICGPVSPGKLMAQDEKDERDAAAAAGGRAGSGDQKGIAGAPLSACSSDMPKAGFMACQKNDCTRQGYTPVESQDGRCLVCGNPQGSLGLGFQWSKCHVSSDGVNAAR